MSDSSRKLASSFGSMLKKKRLERRYQAKQLAMLTGLSAGSISHIESGRMLPSDESAGQIMKVLGLAENEQKEWLAVLESERSARRASTVDESFEFGDVLSEIIESYGLSLKDLARRAGLKSGYFGLIVKGQKLPGDSAAHNLYKVLLKLGVSNEEVLRLRTAHITDIVWRSLPDYIEYGERDEIVRLIGEYYETEER